MTISGTIYQDGSYLEHNPTWHLEHSRWKAAQVRRMLARNRIEPASIAEIGCGAGEILNSLAADLGDTVRLAGYDISPQAYAMCRTRERANLSFHLADLLEQPVHFDLAMALDVFEHVEDYRGFLRRFRGKATYKIFHIPLDLSVQTLLRARPLTALRSTVGHIHFFTREMALATLEETGYEVMDWFYTRGTIELADTWRARALKLPRAALFSLSQDFAVRLLGGSVLVLAR